MSLNGQFVIQQQNREDLKIEMILAIFNRVAGLVSSRIADILVHTSVYLYLLA